MPPERFQLPVERMRDGYYSDKYFVRTRDVLEESGKDPHVTMQVFQKQAAWLGGVDEAIAVLKTCLTDGLRLDGPRGHGAPRRRPRRRRTRA